MNGIESVKGNHLNSLFNHFTDLRDGNHGGKAVSRAEKENLFASAVIYLDKYAKQALNEMNEDMLLNTGTVEATGLKRSMDYGVEAKWFLRWPEQNKFRLSPVSLIAFFGIGFHHPHLRGNTVGNWPLNVFSPEEAAFELPTLRVIAAADLHNLVFQSDYRIIPAIR